VLRVANEPLSSAIHGASLCQRGGLAARTLQAGAPERPGPTTADTYPGRSLSGRVDFIYPDVAMAARTARMRIVLQNPDLPLSPSMFVKIEFKVPTGDQLVILASGVPQSRSADCLCRSWQCLPGAARASARDPRPPRLHHAQLSPVYRASPKGHELRRPRQLWRIEWSPILPLETPLVLGLMVLQQSATP
jgi:hypothetical protein